MLTFFYKLLSYNKYINYIHIIFFTSFILHIIASYYSIGYYSLDEHFQILEPLGNKLNLRLEISSIWEFHEGIRIRPWSQVYFYYYIVKILIFLGLNDPFTWAFFLRLISSMIGFISILCLYNFFLKEINFNKYSLLIFFLFWFYPFIHARTSSENLGISFFIIGTTLLLNLLNNLSDKNTLKHFIKIFIFSFIIGISLVFRFNLVFFAIPLFFWLFYKYRLILINFFYSFGIVFALFIGLISDFFGYNNVITITYFRYFYFNIISKAFERFGVDPWYYYLSEILSNFTPPISFIILLSTLFFWIKNKKNAFTWITIFYFVVFCYLSHKELRFIFPVLYFTPIFCIFFFEYFKLFKIINYLKIFFILINFVFLLQIFLPANREIHLLNYISKNININENLYYVGDENPYLADGLPLLFYTFNMVEIKKTNYEKLNEKNENYWLILKNFKIYNEIKNKNKCSKKYSTYPAFLIENNRNWRDKELNWYVVYCK